LTNNNNKSETVARLDYAGVNQYWNNAQPSILGPYMMEGFGFPASAGQFRFKAERQIVERLIGGVNSNSMLDLGCGIGCWAEYFARHFSKVIAVEASKALFDVMAQQCASLTNVTPIHGDVLSFEPEEPYSMAFLGGMLMYLNESDVIALLRKLIPFIEPGGVILCRETTVRQGTVIRDGDYQVAYRSVQTYTDIFKQCGITSVKVEANLPYILMQMGCESIKKWKEIIPEPLQAIPIAGRLTYCGLRLCNPWITRVPALLGRTFPELTNHFFLLKPAISEDS
jgi:trans-aconitate methyltransferase